MNLQITFANPAQREFYYATARNQCFSGALNNGKTYSGCLKAFTLLTTFANYRMAIARQTFADLKKTTMQTFFKICPREIVERHNEQDGLTVFKNGSTIYWLHLDKVDESTLRGLEINSSLTDQAEEVDEKVYDVLDARIGRWDDAEIPKSMLDRFPDWPTNPKTGKYIAPSYNMLLCNPDTQFHFVFRKFHPDSLEKRSNYFYVEGEWDASLSSAETYQEALLHDEEWVNKFVKGQWGISNAQIHKVPSASLLEYDKEFLDKVKRKGNLFRVLDHGDASPTCCLWWAAYEGVYVCYREYYMPNQVVSTHRRNIKELSENEIYTANYADPQIFKKTAQKDGGFWTVSNEYSDKSITSPPLFWIPADNNEFATRNRINELLKGSSRYKNPVSENNTPGSPGIYFIKKSEENPYGCFHSIKELQSQRRKSLGYIDGKQIFCDEREDSVADHAYDCIRYFVAMHGTERGMPARKVPQNSFKWFKMMAGRQKQMQAASVGYN